MRNIAFMQKLLCLMLLAPILLVSCTDDKDTHYEKPDWLEGSVWDLLENRENYSTFLEAVERTGFRPYLEGKGIVTVMAPDDEAFATYLKEKGISSVESMSVAELNKLVGFHLLYYSYTKDNLENFRPEGQGALDGDEEILDAGMYYKFRTRSSSPASTAIDPATGKEVTIYHLERFIPVFSYNFFNSKQIDAKYNYEYFYPISTWTGSAGFNVSEATVEEYQLVANNGYVYAIDRVLEPLETIYEELKKNPDYTDFLEIYNNYSYYEYDETLSSNYGDALGVDSLFLHKHNDPLPPIALEWPVSNYQRLDTLAYKSYSVFAPSNNALSNFFDSYFKGGGYESITDVDPLALAVLLNEYVYGGSVVFPEEITSGKIVSSYGTTYNFDPEVAQDRKMCVNGSFYGLKEIQGPAVFTSVAGPAYREEKYNHFLYALNGAGWLNLFGSQDYKFTLLLPGNEAFIESEYYLNKYTTGNVLEKIDEDGNWASVPLKECANIVSVHTVMEEVTLAANGTQIIENVVPFNYWYVKNGKITTCSRFNKLLSSEVYTMQNVFQPFTELTYNGSAWNNGKVYTYESRNGLFDSGMDSETMHAELSGSNSGSLPYFAFGQLLKKAGLISGSTILGLTGERMIAFIPTNDAIDRALRENRIPGATDAYVDFEGEVLLGDYNEAQLRRYLLNYFIPASQITSSPYPGSAMQSGVYMNSVGGYINYTDTGSSLSVRLQGGSAICNVIKDYDYFPFAYKDGCFHFIDSIFE